MSLLFFSFPVSLNTKSSKRVARMNATTTLLSNLASLPSALFHHTSAALSSRFSYVQVPHIKLKAEHQALVLFHIAKICLTYWEGWRDGKRNEKGEPGESKKRRKKKRNSRAHSGRREDGRAGRGIMGRVVGRGKYTIVFQ